MGSSRGLGGRAGVARVMDNLRDWVAPTNPHECPCLATECGCTEYPLVNASLAGSSKPGHWSSQHHSLDILRIPSRLASAIQTDPGFFFTAARGPGQPVQTELYRKLLVTILIAGRLQWGNNE